MAETKQEVAFRYAVERVNANRQILSKSRLSAQIEKIPPQDSFHASKRGTYVHTYSTCNVNRMHLIGTYVDQWRRKWDLHPLGMDSDNRCVLAANAPP